MPEKTDCMAAIYTKQHTIRVGNLATCPVCTYSTNTGIRNAVEISVSTKACRLKKDMGL